MESQPRAFRRYNDPITRLPGDRDSESDRHHLFWPRRDVNQLLTGPDLLRFRTIPCTSVRYYDSSAHTLIHSSFAGVVSLDPDEIADFRRHARECLSRHDDNRCSCRNPERIRVIDPFSLEVYDPRRYDGPPCMGMPVDMRVYKLMRDYYQPVAPILPAVRGWLEWRCDNRKCNCYRQIGGQRVHQPRLWDTIPRIPIAA